MLLPLLFGGGVEGRGALNDRCRGERMELLQLLFQLLFQWLALGGEAGVRTGRHSLFFGCSCGAWIG